MIDFQKIFILLFALLPATTACSQKKTPKAVFILVDGIPSDVIEKLNPPTLQEIAKAGGFTRAHVGGDRGTYNETPTISAVGYNSLLTGTWAHKHNVWDNKIKAPNYHYWTIFRIGESQNLTTAIFSTWLDNRTRLVGEGLEQTGRISLDYKFDGLEKDILKYPHDKASAYIHKIDEAVSDEAGRYIAENGPDLSWVYLEYTDDMGHRYGDSPQYYDAIMTADRQIAKVWKAIQTRESKFNEDWLIVITTDHGRGAETGKNHGRQSDRERSTWIVTNSRHLNDRFTQLPGIVDIMPSICNHLQLAIPQPIQQELDAIPFIGDADLADLKAEMKEGNIVLHWKSLTRDKSAKAEVFVTTTNKFKEGDLDDYQRAGDAALQAESFTFKPVTNSTFYKVSVKGPNHYASAWVFVK